MPLSFRILVLALLAALASGGSARAADEAVLPPEPKGGDWLQDTLDDRSLWFASSDNLTSEPIAPGLSDYPRGHRWVGVTNGHAAWVLYYVPGEILGFEIDTHHLGARGLDFRFSAGADWRNLVPVAVSTEELAGFEAKWLRMYRAAESLPPGAHFLRIEFPIDAERDFARLTEVWLRCRCDETPPVASSPAAAIAPAAMPAPKAEDPEIAAFIVKAVRFDPPPAFAPILPGLVVPPSLPRPDVVVPVRVTKIDLLPDVPFEFEVPAVVDRSKNVFSTVLSFLRHGGSRSK